MDLTEDRREPRQLRYRVAFFITGLVTLALVVTLPFSVKSVVDDIRASAVGRVFPITSQSQGDEPATRTLSEHLRHRDVNYTKIHLAVVAIDEVQLVASIRVSGHHRCTDCAYSHRVRLVAIADDDAEAEGMPPSAAITPSPKDMVVAEIVQLPLRGHPIHYPFDRYQMTIGVAYQRLYTDGKREPIGANQADDKLFLSFQELLPRSTMSGPVPIHPHLVQASDDPLTYAYAFAV